MQTVKIFKKYKFSAFALPNFGSYQPFLFHFISNLRIIVNVSALLNTGLCLAMAVRIKETFIIIFL